MTPDPAILDRARGCLLGLAIGDALGTTLEFTPRNDGPPHTEMTGGGPFKLDPGVWTDDTSMALALAASLLSHGRLAATDPAAARVRWATNLMDRFTDWWENGAYSPTGTCFDIGLTTRVALDRYARTEDPFAGDDDEQNAGNGSLMRVAPVALFALNDPARCLALAADQSAVTHAAPQAMLACMVFADALRRAINGEPKASILAPAAWTGHAAVVAVAAGDWRGRPRAEIPSTGYVVHTLKAAFWAVAETRSFEEALILAVNLGDDADTVGAVTGQLAGAIYGMSRVPYRWLSPLAWRDRLLATADALVASA